MERSVTMSKLVDNKFTNVKAGQTLTSPWTGKEYTVTKDADTLTLSEEKYSTIYLSYPCGNKEVRKGMDYKTTTILRPTPTIPGYETTERGPKDPPVVTKLDRDVVKQTYMDDREPFVGPTFDSPVPEGNPEPNDEGIKRSMRVDSYIYSVKKMNLIPPDLEDHSQYQLSIRSHKEATVIINNPIVDMVAQREMELHSTHTNDDGYGNSFYYANTYQKDPYYSRLSDEIDFKALKTVYTFAKIFNDDAAKKSIEKVFKDNDRELNDFETLDNKPFGELDTNTMSTWEDKFTSEAYEDSPSAVSIDM